MTQQIYITGSGGGKSGSAEARTPVESPDSLRSQATAHILDLLCEGEIEGLANGMQSIFLDETPLQNADGGFNFTGVTVKLNTGTQQQSYISGFSDSESEVAVQTEIKAATPVTRQLTDANLDAVRVTVSVASLYTQNTSNGDVNGASVELAIDLQPAGGAWQTVKTDTITGKTMSRYQRAYRVPLTGAAPWQVRVRRITADATASTVQNKLAWDSYTEIIDVKLRYPNSALVGIEASSSQFSNIPTRAYDLKMLRLRVPSNYDPATRTYDGDWDGTFKTAWSDNPAWGFHRVVTHPRYGLGELIPEQFLDKWVLYQIARYCDELVPDGFGGMEPRMTMNVYLQTRADAYKVVNDLASVFRGMAYYAAGMISAAQDAPADPVALYCPANVVDGRFVYQGSGRKARHTVALVGWNNPADFCRQAVEYVEDPEGVARYGINPTQVTAIGCTSRGQARRAGKWLLYSERMETETVSYRVGLDGTYLRPGSIVKLIDPDRDGVRLSGRIHAASLSQVTLDAAVQLEAGKTYDLYCTLPSGVLESRRVSSAPGETAVLNLITPLSGVPQVESVWALAPSDLEPSLFRVLAVAEPEAGQLEITALVHHPEKYAEIEQGIQFDPPATGNLPTAGQVDPPSGLTVTEEIYPAALGTSGVRLLITWQPSLNRYVNGYTCEIRRVEGNWITLPTDGATAAYDGATQGDYQIRVTAVNVLGIKSTPADLVYTVIAMTAPPADVTGLQLYGRGNKTDFDGRECRIAWNRVSTLDGIGTMDGPLGDQPAEGWLRDYVVKIYGEDGLLRRTEFVTIETYNYSYEKNYQDGNGAPSRNLTVQVTARDRWYRESQHPARLAVSNPPPRALTAGEIKLTAFAGAFTVDLTPVRIPDIDGYLVYASQQAGFTPDGSTLVGTGSTHLYRKAVPGTWYVRVAAFDTFGQDALIYSAEYSCTVLDSLILPDQLYTTLRTDFWVRDSIFFFNAAVLEWSEGSIVRAAEVFTLAAGNLAAASDKYVIATLTAGVATVRLAPMSAGIPADLTASEVIIAVTSSQPNTAGNYICYVRQANSMQLEGALLRDATIVDAHVSGTFSANRITSLNGNTAIGIAEDGITLATIIDATDTVTTAVNLQTAANTAQAKVYAARQDFNQANPALGQLSIDNSLTPSDKSATLTRWNAIVAEKAGLDIYADSYTIGAEKTAYDSAYAALSAYITPLLADLGSTSAVIYATFTGKFWDYYIARGALLEAVSAKARDLATAAQAPPVDWNALYGIPLRFAEPAPGGSGLFIGADHFGYYSGGSWKSYQRSDGSFYFAGKDSGHYLRYDGGTSDLVFRGKLTADDIESGGTISGSTLQTGPPGTKRWVVDSASNEMRFFAARYDGVVEQIISMGHRPYGVDNILLGLGVDSDGSANAPLNTIPLLAASIGRTPAIKVVTNPYEGSSPSCAIDVWDLGDTYNAGAGALKILSAANPGIFATSADNHGIIGTSLNTAKYAFYATTGTGRGGAQGSGSYGPFTGAHDGLIGKSTVCDPGDIMVDVTVVHKAGVSDTITAIAMSVAPMQASVLGVLAGRTALTLESSRDISGLSGMPDEERDLLVELYDAAIINALGEGQINVCPEGGDIFLGDFICSSSTAGKGMRQPDDIMHNYTVAKAREACSWQPGDQSIRQIACTYHCG